MRKYGGRPVVYAIACAPPLASSVSYAPLELSDSPDLQSSIGQLTVTADRFPLPELGPHRLPLARALDIDDVAIVAVANNRYLKATRARLGVAEAQAFAAGILPNPQVSLEHGFLFGGPGTDIRRYLWMTLGNAFKAISRDHRYGKVYNRNLPKRLKRDPDSRIPIVPSADNIHLFIMGGHAGRFSAIIPGWDHMSTPVLKPIDPAAGPADDECTDGVRAL
jgi:hypothetical protein